MTSWSTNMRDCHRGDRKNSIIVQYFYGMLSIYHTVGQAFLGFGSILIAAQGHHGSFCMTLADELQSLKKLFHFPENT